MRTSNTCGAPRYIPTTFFPDNSSNLRASLSGSLTSNQCNPNSTWALQCTMSWTESTAAPGNTFNSPMRDLCKLNWHFVTGKNMTTYIFGHLFQSTQTERTTEAWKWHLFKNGNLASIILSFANSSTQRRDFSKNPSKHQCSIWPGNFMASCQTQVHSTTGTSGFDLFQIPKPSGTLDNHPRLRFKYQGKVRANKAA